MNSMLGLKVLEGLRKVAGEKAFRSIRKRRETGHAR
jgi:hypothetical protein